MRQRDHYNNTYNYSQDKTQTTPESKQQSLNTTDRQQHSASYNNSPHNHPACQPTMLEDKHPWTLTQCTKAKENTKEKEKAKESTKGKGYGGYNGYGYNNYHKGKGKPGGKGYNTYSNPIGYGNPFGGKDNEGYKGFNKGKGKGKIKGKQVTDTCYRCGRTGHYAKDCRVAIHNIGQTGPQDNDGHNSTMVHRLLRQWMALSRPHDTPPATTIGITPPIPATSSGSNDIKPIHVIAMIGNGNQQQPTTTTTTDNTHIMIDSGAATHVCPLWFADKYPIHKVEESQQPNLRTVTNKTIHCYGVRWVYMQSRGQPIVIPFYVCDIHDPILSVTRLAEQGFDIRFNDTPTMRHNKGFDVSLVQQHNLYYLPATIMNLEQHQQLQLRRTPEGMIAMIAPTTLTQSGPPTSPWRKQWLLELQQWRIPGEVSQEQKKSTIRSGATIVQYLLKTWATIEGQLSDDQMDTMRISWNNTTIWARMHKNDSYKVMPGQERLGSKWLDNRQPHNNLQHNRGHLCLNNSHSRQHKQSTSHRCHNCQHKQEHNSRQTTENHSFDTQPRSHHRQQRRYQDHKQWHQTLTTGSEKDTCGKRVHTQPRTTLYVPEQSDDGPNIEQLTSERTTMVSPSEQGRGWRIDDNWKESGARPLDRQWRGSTNFEEKVDYKYEYDTDNEDDTQQAQRAKGMKAPQQPTRQERFEHNLTHLPYRTWCPICVKSKGRMDNHPKQTSKQPVIQVDFTYMKAFGDKQVLPVLTAIDVESGMAMAVLVKDKNQQQQYLVRCLQTFMFECGRAQATLSPTTLQTDQEDFILNLLKTVAQNLGANINVRQSPAYSSQSQGSIERYHRTLMGQVRTLLQQVTTSYNLTLSVQHPILPWIVRHAAWLLNRYAIHNDGQTSYQRRWQKDHKAPLCEIGETIQYMIPTTRTQPKMEPRFYKGIWLGRDTMTGESIVGIPGKILRVRTIRRQIMPDKYDRQLLDTINVYPWHTPTQSIALRPQLLLPADPAASSYAIGTQTGIPMTETSTQTQQAGTPLALPASAQQQPADATMATAPLATSPTNITRPALPLPQGKRPHEEPTGQAEPKQSRTAQSSTAANRGQQDEQPHSKMRIQAVTITTKKGDTITTASCEDEQEAEVERMLQEPFVYDNEGLDPKKVQQGMKKEAQSMKGQGVFTEINYNDVLDEYKGKIIESKWVNKPKQDEVRCRIVAKGFLETIQDLDNIYASTPIFGILRILLTMALHKQWTIRAGDVSTAFLHAPAATDNLYMWPPPELYPSGHNSTTVWKLNKAIYGLRSSPKSWQDHFAQVLQQLGLTRLTSEPNVYRNTEQTMFVMVYVDDLLFLGNHQEVNKTFQIQQHVLLRPTGTLGVGQTIQFLGRDIHNGGDYYELSLKPEYITTLLKETKMEASNPATAPGTATLKQSANDEAPLDKQEHADYRRAVGKLQWQTYTRPDISFATKELARDLQQPTQQSLRKLKHLLRYLRGTYIRPTTTPQTTAPIDINIYVDADWAGCPNTRKSTSGFIVTMMGSVVQFGSRTQAVVALSSAESELYAIGTGAQEALHIANFIKEATTTKVNIRIHTDSTSGKSIATRIGSSKKAKHIDLKYLFIQLICDAVLVTIQESEGRC